MEQDSIKIVQEAYAEFSRGNVPAILNLLADDVDWTDPGYPDIPYAGARRGKEQVRDFFVKLNEYVNFTSFVPRTFVCQGDTVVALGDFEGQARATGKSFKSDWAMVWKVRDGKISYYHGYLDTANLAGALKR